MTKNHTPATDLLFLTLLIGGFFLLFLGNMPLHMPDEARYSQIAHEMLKNNNFLVPTINGVAFVDKPIFVYYLQAVSMKLFGINAFAARLPACLLSLSSCLMLYLAGSYLFNRRTGLLSAIILATMPLYFGASHYANMDMPVAALITNALCCFIIGQQSYGQSRRWLLAFYLFSAFALLTKGLIAVFFPVMIIGLWSMACRQRPKLLVVPGALLFIAVVSPWFILIGQEIKNFYYYFFMVQHFYRYLGESFNNQQPLWFFVAVIGLGSLPWLSFVPFLPLRAKEAQTIDTVKKNNRSFVWLWFGFILLFFSLPASKPLGYILPALPPLALLLAYYLAPNVAATRRGCYLLITLALILAAGLIIVSQYPLPALRPFGQATFFIARLLIICALSSLLIANYHPKYLLPVTIAGVMLIELALLPMVQAVINNSNRPLAHHLNTLLTPYDKLVMVGQYNYDILFYLKHRPVYVVDNWIKGTYVDDALVHQLALGMAHFWPPHYILPQRFKAWLKDQHQPIYIVTDNDHYPLLKQHTQLIKRYKNAYLLHKPGDSPTPQ